jgi:hypothetical protein
MTTSLFTNTLVDVAAAAVPANVPTDVLSSGNILNSGGSYVSGLRVSLRFSALLPATDFPVGFQIAARVDHLVDPVAGRWVPFMYQFEALRFSGPNQSQALERVLERSVAVDGFNLGIDDNVFILDRTVLKNSRQPGACPDGTYRVCISVLDADPAGANGLKSFIVDGDYELFDG